MQWPLEENDYGNSPQVWTLIVRLQLFSHRIRGIIHSIAHLQKLECGEKLQILPHSALCSLSFKVAILCVLPCIFP